MIIILGIRFPSAFIQRSEVKNEGHYLLAGSRFFQDTLSQRFANPLLLSGLFTVSEPPYFRSILSLLSFYQLLLSQMRPEEWAGLTKEMCMSRTSCCWLHPFSPQHLWIVRRMFPADRSQRRVIFPYLCCSSNSRSVFFIPTPLLSIDPCNKPNNALFPFKYFISDLFMSESSIVWIVCVKLSPVASRI